MLSFTKQKFYLLKNPLGGEIRDTILVKMSLFYGHQTNIMLQWISLTKQCIQPDPPLWNN